MIKYNIPIVELSNVSTSSKTKNSDDLSTELENVNGGRASSPKHEKRYEYSASNVDGRS
jgi:hypothetical protein